MQCSKSLDVGRHIFQHYEQKAEICRSLSGGRLVLDVWPSVLLAGRANQAGGANQAKAPGRRTGHTRTGFGFYLPQPIFQPGPIIRLHGKLLLMEFLCSFLVWLPEQVAIKVT